MSKPRPICAACRLEMRCVKNDRIVRDQAHGEEFPSSYWAGDQYECPQCHAQVVVGFGDPVAEEKVSRETREAALEFAYEPSEKGGEGCS